MNSAIGGYFGLELNAKTNDRFTHALLLNSGRHAFEYIIRQIKELPCLVYLPYYTCAVILEPLKRLGISFRFYDINKDLEIERLPCLGDNEYIVVNNYYGIKDSYIDNLFNYYKSKLIVDNAQAFFAPERLGLKAFYSPRKYVGVPDGGIAWTTVDKYIDLEQDYSTERSVHLLRRLDRDAESGYHEFKRSDDSLSYSQMRKMSNLTRQILLHLDYDEIIWRRRSNFEILHQALESKNRLAIPEMRTYACPMVYPFWTENENLRDRLIENKVYVATYWPNVLEMCDRGSIEYDLAKRLIPLPIDQRYGEEEMKRIISIIHKNI